uniref:Uncharacterized protein n=1 Tax=Echeneis naucrates TaxID=173247 RepID=A0A665WRR1_ECHNA
MNVTKRLWSLARIVLPTLGFALTCIGAYLVSLQSDYKHTWTVIPAYIMIVFGFLAIIVGLSWTIYLRKMFAVKSKLWKRNEMNVPNASNIFFSPHRPSSFPPSYEESQGIDGADGVMDLAPPLYSQDSLGDPNCMWSWEQPPRYSQVERIQQGQGLTDSA